ncbi:hypothetical protein P9112_000361 [Eukaryota sp. TZLM1-RC]
MPYSDIADYAVIGDCYTTALVSSSTCSIDFLCFPYHDSPSVFASLLDCEKGGSWSIYPKVDSNIAVRTKQMYHFNTNVLITRIFHQGLADITDWMSMDFDREEFRQIYRRVRVIRGEMTFQMKCAPRFDYAREPHTAELEGSRVRFRTQNHGCLVLNCDQNLIGKLTVNQTGDMTCTFTLKEGEETTFLLMTHNTFCSDETLSVIPSHVESNLTKTLNYWHSWIGKCSYSGRWREQLIRSALLLKLLTFKPTGAIIAASTFSLPESIGGDRQFDYRFVWLRDAAFVLYALIRLGFTEETDSFMEFLSKLIDNAEEEGKLYPMYTIHGGAVPDEQELPHLSGYMNSRPVRIGNAAKEQFQLDIYGELLDTIYLGNKYATQISFETWCKITKLCDFVVDHWQDVDSGIWEPRTTQRHHTYSKICSWIALDRAVRLAEKRSLPCDERYKKARDEIYLTIQKNGWNERRGAYTAHFEAESLDASILLAPLTFFISPHDPRMLSTLEQIMKAPAEGGLFLDGLVFRYNHEELYDGFSSQEGTFCLATFWLVEAYTRSCSQGDKKKLGKARLMFEKGLSLSNHLGIFAEEIGIDGRLLGNFPQALTHLTLISAGYNLDRTLGPGP